MWFVHMVTMEHACSQAPTLYLSRQLACDWPLLCLLVSELQEEGMNAINLPLSPIPFELDPEDTMLGNCVPFVSLNWLKAFECSLPSTECLFFFKRRTRCEPWWIPTHAVTPNFRS